MLSGIPSIVSEPVSPSATEVLSGITGSISLAAWIFVFVPQLLENYQNGNADGLSLMFVLVWTIGDIANLAGATWAHLVPTVIAIAVYFCFADSIILLQALYYKLRNRKLQPDSPGPLSSSSPDSERASHDTDETLTPSEDSPLLSRSRSSSGPVRRYSRSSQKSTVAEKPHSHSPSWLRDLTSLALVCAIGACGWAIAWQAGAWRPTDEGPDGGDAEADGGTNLVVGAQMLGYFSAACYLGARIPQIWKNYSEKSCDGLSRLFFLLSVLGNLTYGAGILFHSLEERYILTNLPWLIGSLGTLAEDFVIFFQFHIYRRRD